VRSLQPGWNGDKRSIPWKLDDTGTIFHFIKKMFYLICIKLNYYINTIFAYAHKICPKHCQIPHRVLTVANVCQIIKLYKAMKFSKKNFGVKFCTKVPSVLKTVWNYFCVQFLFVLNGRVHTYWVACHGWPPKCHKILIWCTQKNLEKVIWSQIMRRFRISRNK